MDGNPSAFWSSLIATIIGLAAVIFGAFLSRKYADRLGKSSLAKQLQLSDTSIYRRVQTILIGICFIAGGILGIKSSSEEIRRTFQPEIIINTILFSIIFISLLVCFIIEMKWRNEDK
jgi:hypothetical protein